MQQGNNNNSIELQIMDQASQKSFPLMLVYVMNGGYLVRSSLHA